MVELTVLVILLSLAAMMELKKEVVEDNYIQLFQVRDYRIQSCIVCKVIGSRGGVTTWRRRA